MRISLIGDSLNLEEGYGGDFSLDLLARMLTDQGHEVTVATVNHVDENALPSSPVYDVHPIDIGEIGTSIDVAKGLVRFMKAHERETDIYNITIAPYVAAGGMYAVTGGSTPVFGRLNNYAFCSNHSLIDGHCFQNCTTLSKMAHSSREPIEKAKFAPKYLFDTYALPRAMNAMDGLYALSPAVKNIYVANGVDESNIEIIPNPVDPRFGTEHTSESTTSDQLSILYVGRLQAQKGVDVLLSSMNHLTDVDVKLTIVGDGPERASFEQQSRTVGPTTDVEFTGYLPQESLPERYAECDLFVHPGRWPEPFGRTILEAMQMESVPLVSDIGGPPWVVGDERLTFEVESSEDLARTIHTIEGNDEYRELQEHCRRRLTEFQPQAVVEQVESLFYDNATTHR